MRSTALAGLLLAGLLLSGCAGTPTETGPTSAGGSSNPYPAPSGTVHVTGSGSSFAFPILDAWRTVYANAQPTVQVNYESKGSGTGKTNLKNGDDLFAGSDSPLSAADRAAYPTILTFPESLGPIAVVYNVDGVTADGLKLDGETLGRIYTGAITKWNDAAIAAANPGLSLPASTITIVYRSDSSGTTFVFTDFLGKASTTWASTMGAAATQTPKWNQSAAQQSSGPQNDGVADKVNAIHNSIGYVELSYVKTKGLHAAAIQNKAGQYLMPTPDGATAAASAFAGSLPAADGDWGKVSLVNADGANAYPISTFTYLMVKSHVSDYAGKFDANQMAGFKSFAWWALHDGQAYAKPLGYAPLPQPVVAIGEHALTLIS